MFWGLVLCVFLSYRWYRLNPLNSIFITANSNNFHTLASKLYLETVCLKIIWYLSCLKQFILYWEITSFNFKYFIERKFLTSGLQWAVILVIKRNCSLSFLYWKVCLYQLRYRLTILNWGILIRARIVISLQFYNKSKALNCQLSNSEMLWFVNKPVLYAGFKLIWIVPV